MARGQAVGVQAVQAVRELGRRNDDKFIPADRGNGDGGIADFALGKSEIDISGARQRRDFCVLPMRSLIVRPGYAARNCTMRGGSE